MKRITFFIALIVFFIFTQACKKETVEQADPLTEEEDSKSADTDTNDDDNNDTDKGDKKDPDALIETLWITSASDTNSEGSVTSMQGILRFEANNAFSYAEHYDKLNVGAHVEILDSISGSYTYTGEKGVDGNVTLSYTYGASSDYNDKGYYFEESGIEYISVSIAGVQKSLEKGMQAQISLPITGNALNGKLYLSNEYTDFQQETVDIGLEFVSDTSCTITTNYRSTGNSETDNGTYVYDDDNEKITITYTDNTYGSGQENTTTGTIAPTSISIEFYGEDLTFTLQ